MCKDAQNTKGKGEAVRRVPAKTGGCADDRKEQSGKDQPRASEEADRHPDRLEWHTRPYRKDDLPYVLASWRDSWWPVYARTIAKGDHRRLVSGIQTRFLERYGVILVAVATDCDEQIFGWAAAESGVLRYVYTKLPFRRQGIARDLVTKLLGDGPVVTTAMSRDGMAAAQAAKMDVRSVW